MLSKKYFCVRFFALNSVHTLIVDWKEILIEGKGFESEEFIFDDVVNVVIRKNRWNTDGYDSARGILCNFLLPRLNL